MQKDKVLLYARSSTVGGFWDQLKVLEDAAPPGAEIVGKVGESMPLAPGGRHNVHQLAALAEEIGATVVMVMDLSRLAQDPVTLAAMRGALSRRGIQIRALAP